MHLACVTVTSAAPEFPPAPERRSLTLLPVHLGTAGDYAILTKSGVTTTGVTLVTGDIGTSPIAATALTGFGLTLDSSTTFSTSTLVVGNVYAADYAVPTPAKMTTAISDMELAYTAAAGVPPLGGVEKEAGLLGGVTLTGGVYKWTTDVTVQANKELVFEGNPHGPEAVWIMQIDGGLNFMAGATVVLKSNAKASNIFWQVAGAVTVLSGAKVQGNILCKTAITFGSEASLTGRALAQTAVTMIATTVVKSS